MNRVAWQPTSPPVTAETFYDTLISSDATILHFWAIWDEYNQLLDARLEQLQSALAPPLDFYSVDVDKAGNWQICSRYNIQTTPTLLFFAAGNLRDKFVGAGPQNRLEDRLKLWRNIILEPA